MATLVQYPAITLDSGNNTNFYYRQVAIKASFRSDPTVEGARGASSNRAIGAAGSGGAPQNVTWPDFVEKMKTVPRA
jgi:hypothetical protein